MSLFRPPNPVIIGSGGVSGGGSSINTSASSVSISSNDNGRDTISLTTNNVEAVKVDENQNVVIGSTNYQSFPFKRLVVSAEAGQCVQLINETTGGQTTLVVNQNGELAISSDVRLGSNSLFLNSGKLFIGANPVTATAAQLNYTNVTAGIASPTAALVVNANRDISNINSLSASILSGTLQTASQPNITSLNSVNIESLSLSGTQLQASANEINYLYGTTVGIVKPSRVLVADASKNMYGFNNLSAETLTGTIQTNAQPNITSIGVLHELNVETKIGVGTTSPSKSVDIVSTNPSIRLSDRTNSVEILIDSNGNLRLSPDQNISIAINKNILFGGTSSLIGLNSVIAQSLTGVLQTSAQPYITSIGDLSSLTVNGDVVFGTFDSPSSSYRVTIKEPFGNCISIQRSSSLKCELTINEQGDLVLNPTRDIALISGKGIRMSGSISGVTNLTALTISGTLQTSQQPNITSIGTLTSLTVSETISAASITVNDITGTLLTPYQPNITSVGTLISLNVIQSVSCDVLNANTISGALQTAHQPNITSIGTLSSLTVTNSVICSTLQSNEISGTILTSYQPNIKTIGTLTTLIVSDTITTSTINSNEITGTILTPAQPNITSIGTLSKLNVTGPIGIGIATPSCAIDIDTTNISSSSMIQLKDHSTRGSISLTSNGFVIDSTGNYFTLESGISLKFINGSIIGLSSLAVDDLYGTILTSSQPYITSIGTLNKLLLNGPIGIGVGTPAYAIDIDTSQISTTAGINLFDGSATGSFILNSSGISLNTNGAYFTLQSGTSLRFTGGSIIGLASLSVNELSGTIQTSSQPYITEIGKLNFLETDYIGIGTSYNNQFRVSIEDASGKIIRVSTGNEYFILSTANGDYTISTSNKRIALGYQNDLVLNEGTIIGLDNLNANTISGTITTPAQPNITSIGTLTSLNVSGDINAANAEFDSASIIGDLIVGGSLTLSTPLSFSQLNSSSAIFDANIAASSITNGGTLTVIGGAAFSKNVIIGESLTLGTSTITESMISILSNASIGVVVPETILMADVNKDLIGFRNLTANNIGGTILTAYQPNITTIGNLTNLNVNGYLGVGTLSPMKQLEVNSSTGDCLRLRYNGTTSLMDVTVDSLGNGTISTSGPSLQISSVILTNQIRLGNTTNTTMPLELGFTPFTMTQSYAYNTNLNGHGVINPSSSPTSYNYSIRALGRILCTQSVDVMSDRRTKKNIQVLSSEYCESFIEQTNPVSFNWVDGDPNKSFGYIAQDVMKAGFHDLVNLAKDDNVEEEIDDDGFISPSGVKFTISYQHIIPILAMNQKKLLKENAELKAKLDTILQMLQRQ